MHDLSLGWEGGGRLGELLQLGEAEVVLLAVHGPGLVPDLGLLAGGGELVSDLSVRGHHVLLAADLGLMENLLLADLSLGREEPSQVRGSLLGECSLRSLLLAAVLALM